MCLSAQQNVTLFYDLFIKIGSENRHNFKQETWIKQESRQNITYLGTHILPMTPSHCSVNRSWYFSSISFIFWEGLELSVTTEFHQYGCNILQTTLGNLNFNNFKMTLSYLGGFRSSLDLMFFET